MELVLYIAVLLLALTSVVFILLNLQKQKSLQALQQQQAQTVEQYNALYEQVKAGEITISSDIDNPPAVEIAVDYQND